MDARLRLGGGKPAALPGDLDVFLDLADVPFSKEEREPMLRAFVGLSKEGGYHGNYGFLDPFLLNLKGTLLTRTDDPRYAGWARADNADALVGDARAGVPLPEFRRRFAAEVEAAVGDAALLENPLALAVRHRSRGTFSPESLLAAGADPDGRTRSGVPVLHLCADAVVCPAVAALLLDAGADPDAAAPDGRTFEDALGRSGLLDGERRELLARARLARAAGPPP